MAALLSPSPRPATARSATSWLCVAWLLSLAGCGPREPGAPVDREAPDRAAAPAPGSPLAEAEARLQRGTDLLAKEDFGPAEEDLQQALALRRQWAAGTLAEAAAWHALAKLHQARAELEKAEAEHRAALELRSRLAPGSLEHGASLQGLGEVAMLRGRYDDAGRELAAALEIARRQAPEGLAEAQVLNTLGSLATRMGRLDEADAQLSRAAAILARVEPRGEDMVRVLLNRAKVASSRGDLAQSDAYLHDALAIYGTPPPETGAVAAILYRLGRNATERGDLEGAAELARRSLAINQRLTPGTLNEAASLTSLSWLAFNLGRLDEAEETSRAALAIRTRAAPDSLSVAESLQVLGLVAVERQNFLAAEENLGEAVAIARRQSPGSLHESSALTNLGLMALRASQWQKAVSPLRQALEISHRLSPGSNREANALVNLGDAYRGLRDFHQAEAAYAAGVDILEVQMAHLGGTDASRASYLEPYLRFHQRLIDLQLAHGRRAEALRTLERSRGRSLLFELARRELAAAGSLTSPRILSLDEIRASLDPGTAWLSFSVGYEQTYLFVVRPQTPGTEAAAVEVFTIPMGIDRLAEEAAVFRTLILGGQQEAGAGSALLAQARKLYDLLLAPAEASFRSADRLLISPDGPLNTLPFAALARAGEPPRFLVEEKPVHLVVSATLYAELRRRGSRAAPADGRLVAFGDPLFREASGAASSPHTVTGAGLAGDADESPTRRYERGLTPIPGTRAEVEALVALYPERSRSYLGADATERAVKALDSSPRYLHFATHALVDPRSPLDSALALATPEAADEVDDGLLRAWEIFETLRLDTDLVTLSACDTALGKDAAGEGLLGLTRAFQYAGARSVLASLWPVSDRSTAELMRRFYSALAAGVPKDLALAEAQRALAHMDDPKLSHPFHWAAFELLGDWR